ncbi:hypothetical protein L914_19562 [Phytophthora nicotianae]|uniref:Uncharacterized protein n=1 Tax=Phytophthora nicotianae TaxID=4792 RepID=W2MC96_PHYNI|nr:hypothetical protein L914_19562 [Phytophthora nicotianae]
MGVEVAFSLCSLSLAKYKDKTLTMLDLYIIHVGPMRELALEAESRHHFPICYLLSKYQLLRSRRLFWPRHPAFSSSVQLPSSQHDATTMGTELHEHRVRHFSH